MNTRAPPKTKTLTFTGERERERERENERERKRERERGFIAAYNAEQIGATFNLLFFLGNMVMS
jgi:hypothetical protein